MKTRVNYGELGLRLLTSLPTLIEKMKTPPSATKANTVSWAMIASTKRNTRQTASRRMSAISQPLYLMFSVALLAAVVNPVLFIQLGYIGSKGL